MADIPILPSGLISARLKAVEGASQSPEQQRITDSLWRLREAAAVQVAFDPATLEPVGGTQDFDDRARLKFVSDLAPIEGASEQAGWRLTSGVRRLALDRCRASDPQSTRSRLLAALDANPDRPDDPAQSILKDAIKGSLPPIDTLDHDQLAALNVVTGWLGGVLDDLPDAGTLARSIGRAELLLPHEKLAGEVFVGRDYELQRLADHVGALPVEFTTGTRSWLTSVGRRLSQTLREAVGRGRRALFVYGPGGVGKSTLMARFILDHAAGPQAIPFVVLDVDRPSVEPLRPLTFLVEALAQLVQQFESLRQPAQPLTERILSSLERNETVSLESIVDDAPELIKDFASLVQPIVGEALLMIVDTFEEVQYLGEDVETIVYNFIERLERALPPLKVVYVGRVRPQRQDFYQLALDDLPPEAAKVLIAGMLRALDAKVPPADVLDDVVDQVGGNPMVLRLSARLLAEDDLEGLKQSTRRERLKRIRVEALQARLYGRILGHLHDDELRQLAYPGLVVRRITPELVVDVLAEICELTVRTAPDATLLLQRMAKEVALVSTGRDGALVYRSDIRRVMLESLGEVLPKETIARIDREAANFWSKRPGAIARAEELYHRLRLGEARDVLESRWDPEAALHLRGALGEVPDASRAWLADKLGASLDETARSAAGLVDWETTVARIARRFLETGQPAEALRVLEERPDRTEGSPLYGLHAHALYALDRLNEAAEVVEQGLASVQAGGDAPAEIDLRLLHALVLERQDVLPAAESQVAGALAVAVEAGVRRPLLKCFLRMLRLRRKLGGSDTRPLQDEAAVLLDTIGIERLLSDTALMLEAAAELGAVNPRLLETVLDHFGPDVLARASQPVLVEVLQEAGRYAPKDIERYIRGDRRQLGRLANSALKSALHQKSPDAVGAATELCLAVLREASDPALIRRSAETPSTSAADEWPTEITGTQAIIVRKLIADNFSLEELRRIVQLYSSRRLEDYAVLSEPHETLVFKLIQGATNQGWLPQLLESLAEASRNPKLRGNLKDVFSAVA